MALPSPQNIGKNKGPLVDRGPLVERHMSNKPDADIQRFVTSVYGTSQLGALIGDQLIHLRKNGMKIVPHSNNALSIGQHYMHSKKKQELAQQLLQAAGMQYSAEQIAQMEQQEMPSTDEMQKDLQGDPRVAQYVQAHTPPPEQPQPKKRLTVTKKAKSNMSPMKWLTGTLTASVFAAGIAAIGSEDKTQNAEGLLAKPAIEQEQAIKDRVQAEQDNPAAKEAVEKLLDRKNTGD